MLASAIEKGIDPDSTYYTSAPFTCTQSVVVRGRLQGREAVAGLDLRPHLRRLDLDHERDAALRQHGLRAAHARRRPGLRVADGEAARRAPDAEAGRVDRARPAVGLAARHGDRVRDLRLGRDLRGADGDHEGRAPERPGRRGLGLGPPADEARALAGRRVEGERHPPPERALRHRLRLERRRPPERGQDRHDRGPRRRVVRRLHARPLDRGLDGLSRRRDPDARRARRGGRGRHVRRPDLARLHGGRRGPPPGARLHRPEEPAGVQAVHAPVLRLLVHPAAGDDDDHHHDDDHAAPHRARRSRPSRRPAIR